MTSGNHPEHSIGGTARDDDGRPTKPHPSAIWSDKTHSWVVQEPISALTSRAQRLHDNTSRTGVVPPAKPAAPIPDIIGYRTLSDEEKKAINKLKVMGNELGDYLAAMTVSEGVDQRWLSIGITQIQQGLMAATRAIAKPDSF